VVRLLYQVLFPSTHIIAIKSQKRLFEDIAATDPLLKWVNI